MTNSPDAVRAFFDECKGRVVFKVFTGTSWQFAETRLLTKEHFALLANLRYAPVIFQEAVDPAIDLRVTVIDQEVFSVVIKPSQKGAKLDWRLDPSARIEPYLLPQVESNRSIELINSLGLRYGALDFRITPQGEHVFLEVNPGGQFLFVDIHGGQHVADAMATALCKGRDLQNVSFAAHRDAAGCTQIAQQKVRIERSFTSRWGRDILP